MLEFCFAILTITVADTTGTIVDSTAKVSQEKSILFKNEVKSTPVESFQYNHQQGFFCDFEDKINKNRYLNFNIGVGEQ